MKYHYHGPFFHWANDFIFLGVGVTTKNPKNQLNVKFQQLFNHKITLCPNVSLGSARQGLKHCLTG